MLQLPATPRYVVVSHLAAPSAALITALTQARPGCEMHTVDLTGIGQESQQIDHHHATTAEQALQDKLEQLLQDRKYTGAAHVFVMQGDEPTSASPTQVGMMKAMLERSMTARQEVVAILLPPEAEETSEESQANFLDAVAATEALVSPFGVKVFTDIVPARRHLLSCF